jgi:hypothetical protein
MLCQKGMSAGLLHNSIIKYLAFAALNKALCLPVEIGDGAAKGLDRILCGSWFGSIQLPLKIVWQEIPAFDITSKEDTI